MTEPTAEQQERFKWRANERADRAEAELAAVASLGHAWQEAEAAAQALGPDWHLAVVNRDVRADSEGYVGWRASANDGKYLEQSHHADTPAAALRALTEKLRAARPTDEETR